jgi:uncharacterized caspase-like protein
MSQERDVAVENAPSARRTSTGRSLIAVVGIDRYQNWPRIANGVRDAKGVAELFQRLGFELAAAPLLDDLATGKAVWSLVTDDLKTLEPDDSLIIFYAGHGTTQKHQLGQEEVKTGYLIPVDAENKIATWIELEGWLRAVALLPAKHILVILDACHSGIALDSLIKWRDKGSWRKEPLSALRIRRSRRIITSALDDQVALDSGPVHGHSLFTGCLIEALAHGMPGASDQITTGSELGLYLQRRVETYPHSRQTPDFGTFAFDDRGEMVIPLMHAQQATTSTAPPDASDSLVVRDTAVLAAETAVRTPTLRLDVPPAPTLSSARSRRQFVRTVVRRPCARRASEGRRSPSAGRESAAALGKKT